MAATTECHHHPLFRQLLLLLCLFARAAGNADSIADGSEPGDVTLPSPSSAMLPPAPFQSHIRITPPPCEYEELAREVDRQCTHGRAPSAACCRLLIEAADAAMPHEMQCFCMMLDTPYLLLGMLSWMEAIEMYHHCGGRRDASMC